MKRSDLKELIRDVVVKTYEARKHKEPVFKSKSLDKYDRAEKLRDKKMKKDEVSTSGAAGAFATPMAFQKKTLTPKKTKKIKN